MLNIIFSRGCLSRNPSFLSSGGVWTDSDLVWRRHRLQLADDQQRDILRLQSNILSNYLSYQCEDNWCWCGSYQLRSRPCYCRAYVTLKLHTTYFETNTLRGTFIIISNIVANGSNSQVPADNWDTLRPTFHTARISGQKIYTVKVCVLRHCSITT